MASGEFCLYCLEVKLAAYLVISIAPIGALTTFIALTSGSIWGIPTWGTWWQWDARITSTLILFIMYLGLISLHTSFSNYEKADKLLSWLAIVGAINIPIIKKSVDWWSTLHQPASITLTDKPAIDPSMLYPLIGSMIGFFGIIICLVIISSKYQILLREKINHGLKIMFNFAFNSLYEAIYEWSWNLCMVGRSISDYKPNNFLCSL